ncbi:MAG: hypothetical protein ACFBSC_15940 [Microcoleaceae cyanobacterium]
MTPEPNPTPKKINQMFRSAVSIITFVFLLIGVGFLTVNFVVALIEKFT